MALIISKQFDDDVLLPQSYAKITNIRGDKNGLTFSILYFNSQSSYDNGKPCVRSESKSFIPSQDENSLRWDKQIYEYLKTLPGFEGAIDVPENGGID